MRGRGFTLLEFLICCSLLLVIVGFALPWARSWIQQNQRDMLAAQIIQIITYSKTQALLMGAPIRLTPVLGGDNWDLGMQLSADSIKHQVLYEWSWNLHGMHLTWHGFQAHDYLRFDIQARHQALNGYFLIEYHGHILEKIILNRLGDIRVELGERKVWSN